VKAVSFSQGFMRIYEKTQTISKSNNDADKEKSNRPG
jgi:hypothetical protein